MIDQNTRSQIIDELMARLGNEASLERIATRASVTLPPARGDALPQRFERLIKALDRTGGAALVRFLEAAHTEAGGGFEVRHRLAVPEVDDWDISDLRTTLVRRPENADLLVESPMPVSTAPLVATVTGRPVHPRRKTDFVTPEPPVEDEAPPEATASMPGWISHDESTGVTPSAAEFWLRVSANLEHSTSDLPVARSSRHAFLNAPGAVGMARLEAREAGRPQLTSVHFVPGAGPAGTLGVLSLRGEGLEAPLWIEVQDEPRRPADRTGPRDACLLLSHREISGILQRRVRVSRNHQSSAWVSIAPGSQTDLGRPWPALRPGTAYVPPGEYRLAGEKTPRRLERGVQLALTPVTNRELVSFLEQTGYTPEHPVAFLQHYRPGAVIPDAFWGHPVLYVNYLDALAYCQWVGGMLPTVEAWERAAAGENNSNFPWGAAFDPHRLNCRETRVGWTTPVDRYPEGRGPYGHLDLAGNVWEWTSSAEDEVDRRILKGGAWVNDRRCAMIGYRAMHRIELRSFYVGFRVAWELPEGWS